MIAELKTFLVAAQLESFAATAETVGLTQSAVSAQIKRLELEFGYPLFHRTGRAVQLSKAGLIAIDRANEIINLFENMKEIHREDKISGTIKVGVISTAYSSLLAPAMSNFLHQFKDVFFSIRVDISLELLQKLETKEIDLAIIVKPPFGLIPDMEWIPLVSQPYVLVMHEKIADTGWKDILNTYPLIRYASRSFGGSVISNFLKIHQISPNDATETEAIDLILDMVSRENGVAIIPSCQELSKYDNLKQISIPEMRENREIGIMILRTRRANLVSQFVSCIHSS
ncbi:LysR family transcriptional regulator [Neokomagataea thailandica NBRC 106555]|uniref:LysR family transcriptional regulator n=2 Tax=Neokomagataea TaxID=1223423 RepID=A0A4Y6V8Q0_9PROT|nr:MULTISPECIES: LysR family transcriptional regulator [Neokomagataea]QDH25248.1 LysR family transcriptional regulator [Neokomagataea tanensis]GBR54311.1 LysR family transcriptional regulator [Neokomagataea thailandica NBRC 106555]